MGILHRENFRNARTGAIGNSWKTAGVIRAENNFGHQAWPLKRVWIGED